ncbi:integrator complex subunit 1-like [Centruroides sculpturatus]|uniref:integrator complex subunit 1-like n=1 Tax=Centruroides sculpturatus TaxID=218467 RepID=UPI000C6D9408|nr:integrator complex subunit 1-like [Centruroides sculpturatus]
MDREKTKGALKRGPNKVKALFPPGDFIALGTKSARTDTPETKVTPKVLGSTSSSSERKRESSSSSSTSGIPTKKQKLSSVPPITPIGRLSSHGKHESGKTDQWDSIAIEVDPSELLNKIFEAEDMGDDNKVELMLLGSVKHLKISRAKPEPSLYLSLMYLAKSRPMLFLNKMVVEAFCSLLKRDVSVNFKTKGNNLVSILAANVLMASHHDEGRWPESFIKVYVEDSLGERIWVDHDDCKGFVDNILTAFNTKIPPKSMLAPERSFRPDACPSPPTIGTDDDEASSSSLSLECRENLENIVVIPRYLHIEDSIEKYILEVLHDQLTRRQPMEISRNTIRLLVSTCGISEVRLMVAQKLEMWLQNPKLTRPAQDLLLAVCLNCSQHNQHDVDIISLLIKIRLKTKPVINHFFACMKELLNQHCENLCTVLKHAIYNELSNARNPNNMQLLGIIFQHSSKRAAKVLAEVFQDLLINRDDYLRALRALFREIVRTVRHDLNFSAFCCGLLQERKELMYKELDQQLRERLFLSITDLISLAILLAISPAVRDAAIAYNRGDKKDIAILKNYQTLVANIQKDVVVWMHTVVPKMIKPNRNEYVHCFHKAFFMEQADHYCNKDNWPPESDRMLMLRLASEVPVLEETLMRILIIGLSRDHPLNAADTIELADHLIKRAASVHMDSSSSVIHIERNEIFEALFNLSAYHHPENISLPQGYHPPNLAISELYWKAWIMLLIIVAHNPSTYGRVAWENYPTLRSMMEMCITNQIIFPPPTMAMDEKADEMCNTELQISQLERDKILEFEIHLAAASTKVTITEHNSLLLSKLITMDPCGVVRKPPAAVMEQLKSLNQTLKIGHLLCHSRNPDFLLDIIHRQGTSRSMPWLAELVESSEGSFNMLPVQCLCEFLLNESSNGALNLENNEDSKDEIKNEKGEKVKNRKKQKQQQLLQFLQNLLHNPSEDALPTSEVLDYFMRRLSSQQFSARSLSVKALNLLLSQPNKSPSSDDDDLFDKDASGEYNWILKHLPLLPHFEAVKIQISHALRQACKVENDPAAVIAYVCFLSMNTPDDSLQDFSDLALDMAQLIVERPIINCILPQDLNYANNNNTFLIAISDIFIKYLRKAKEPSKEAYSWSSSQGHILVHWSTGEAATMHILVVHAMIILLTYGPPNNPSQFYELLQTWFPSDCNPPQAFLVDTSEEAQLLPDWLKLRMIRSSVDILVDAALKDLEPDELVLFVQSFGLPVSSMSKLLHTLDLAVEYDSSAVEQVVVDKAYMSQLVEVQHQRGAVGGTKFAQLLLDRDDDNVKLEDSSPLPAQTPVIQRAPPKPPTPLSPKVIHHSLLQLFLIDKSAGILTSRQQQDLFKRLQKALSQCILNKSDSSSVSEFIIACEQILRSEDKIAFIQALHNKISYSSALFKIVLISQANSSVSSPLTLKLLWICRQIVSHSPKKSSFLSIIKNFTDKLCSFDNSSCIEDWQQKLNKIKSSDKLDVNSIIEVFKALLKDKPAYLEEAVKILVKESVMRSETRVLIEAMTKLIIENTLSISKSDPVFCLFVDWIEQLEPEIISSCPEFQQTLLFFRKENNVKTSEVPVPFRPYLLALLTHQAGWRTLHYCINLVLSPNENIKSKFHSSAVLDFLWACMHIPKIWQGRVKKTPKHYTENVLVPDEAQICCVIDYIIEEAIEKDQRLPNFETNIVIMNRLQLLLKCCNFEHTLNAAVSHLVNIIAKTEDKLKIEMAQQLFLQMYFQIPSLIRDITDISTLFKDIEMTTNNFSKLDVISHTLLTSLAAADSSKHCYEHMTDLDLICRKIASAHPILLLRQLPMLTVLLRGRVSTEYIASRARNHVTFFTCILGLLELLSPYIFKQQYVTSLDEIFKLYIEFFQIHAPCNRDLVSLLNRFLLFLKQYFLMNPQNAQKLVQDQKESFQELFSIYPEVSNLRTIMTGTALQQWSHDILYVERDPSTSKVGPLGSSWNQGHLSAIGSKLSMGHSIEEVCCALQDLENMATRKVQVLDYFLDDFKRLIQNSNSQCRNLAFTLLIKHLKTKPHLSRLCVTAYLQCLESEHRDVVHSALKHLPEFVILVQEFASLLLQKAFIIGISTNVNSIPHICEAMILLNMQSGS